MTEFKRKICWPKPDATCLEGGCGYCNDGKWKTFSQIERYVNKAGVLPNRGIGSQDAQVAWQRGLRANFYGRIEVRSVSQITLKEAQNESRPL